MKKRYLYALLFGIPGFFVAGIISILIFGAVIGVLWVYVFGDDSWPAAVENVLSISLTLFLLIAWAATIVIGYFVGKRLEKDPGLNKGHVLVSGALTLVFIFFIVFQQFSVGNIGPKSATVLCSEFCIQHGYSGSGIPAENSGDRICSCYDDSGNEVMKIPLDHIDPDAQK